MYSQRMYLLLVMVTIQGHMTWRPNVESYINCTSIGDIAQPETRAGMPKICDSAILPHLEKLPFTQPLTHLSPCILCKGALSVKSARYILSQDAQSILLTALEPGVAGDLVNSQYHPVPFSLPKPDWCGQCWSWEWTRRSRNTS